MEYFLAFLSFVAAFIAAVGQTWDHSRKGWLRFTRWGHTAIAVAVIALILSCFVIYKNNKAQEESDKNQKIQIETLKQGLDTSHDIKEEQITQLKKINELAGQQEQQLKGLKELTKQQQEQLSLSSGLAESQKKEVQLSKNLTEEQRKQIRQVEKLSLDRDLSGVEISFEPSAEQWGRISHACNRIKSPSSDFPYSASTITAERRGDYWQIDFAEIRGPKGTFRPPPVTTDKPEYKTFEEVIDLALIELSMTWCDDANLVSWISRRGNYPTSIKISREIIAFTFRPPDLNLGLVNLRDKPTITFRGQQEPTPEPTIAPAPAYIRVRSLDNKVKFNEKIKLNWEEKRGIIHQERWMPYISGPHKLNLDWSYFRR